MKKMAVWSCVMAMMGSLIVGCVDTSTNTDTNTNTTGQVTDVGTVPTVEGEPIEMPVESSKMLSNVMAVCVGLTAVNPSYYNGWAGDCPGCDVDAKGLAKLFANSGIRTRLLLNATANWRTTRACILSAANMMKTNDLLIVAVSGHGGQVADDNGDESDRLDETWCLWDGQVRDDDVLKMIKLMPAGLRLVIINDQCHSEGNFRAIVRSIQQSVSMGYWGSVEARPIVQNTGDWKGQLIQFAGCRENNYSYGASSGGTWTQSLLRNYNNKLTWNGWFVKAKSQMPANQVPQWVTYGNIQSNFVNGTVLR